MEARNGALSLERNQVKKVKLDERLTARPTGRAETKVGFNDLVV